MLEQIRGPADLQHLSQQQLRELAAEIREFLIHKVAATGGRLGPNLGMIELTLALHRVFDSPHDPIIFDTGHQAYVHKMLTGRCQDFERPAQKGRAVGVPVACRERTRLGGVQPRQRGVVVRRRPGQSLRADRSPQPARGRGGGGWRAHRRYVLGGAEQHRRFPPSSDHRGE